MAQYRFHTNIKCEACEAKIKTQFEQVEGIESFSVDLLDAKRPLEVNTQEGISEQQVIDWVQQAGYEATPIRKNSLKSFFKKS